MANNKGYKQFIMLLDPSDEEEAKLIDFLEAKHTKKNKGSYSSLLKAALKLFADKESEVGQGID